MPDENSIPARLCLTCGMCCNGVLFRDVELQPGDDAERLATLGLPIERLKTKSRFPQPCAALGEDCRCRIYAERPQRCQQFDCALLQSAVAEKISVPSALSIIQQAHRRAEKVRRFLRVLGDQDEHIALSLRFKRTRRRMESGEIDSDTAEAFGELTLAVHSLNVLLSARFYPPSGSGLRQ